MSKTLHQICKTGTADPLLDLCQDSQLKARGWSRKWRGLSCNLICGQCGCEMTAAGKRA